MTEECPNLFLCDCCKKTYHRARSHEEAWEEHQIRMETIEGYADDEEPAEVCDDCFKKIMKHMGH